MSLLRQCEISTGTKEILGAQTGRGSGIVGYRTDIERTCLKMPAIPKRVSAMILE